MVEVSQSSRRWLFAGCYHQLLPSCEAAFRKKTDRFENVYPFRRWIESWHVLTKVWKLWWLYGISRICFDVMEWCTYIVLFRLRWFFSSGILQLKRMVNLRNNIVYYFVRWSAEIFHLIIGWTIKSNKQKNYFQ